MTEAIKLLVDLISPIWPFKIVHQWEHGLYYVFGRYQWTCKPGLKVVVPYFTDVKTVSMVGEIESTPLQTVTLRDGRTLTYSASMRLQVIDANKAYNRIGHWSETTIELAAGIVSECLADAEPERFDPARGKRERLLNEIREEINTESEAYGVRLTTLRLNNLAFVRTLRLLTDRSVLETKH